MSARSISGVSGLCPCSGTVSRYCAEAKKMSSLVVYCKISKSDPLEKPPVRGTKKSELLRRNIKYHNLECTRAMAQQVSFLLWRNIQCFTEIPLYKGRHPTRIPIEEPDH